MSCRRSSYCIVLEADEPNRPLGRTGRRHEFAQGVEGLLELVAAVLAVVAVVAVVAESVVLRRQRLGLFFEFGQPLGWFAVRGHQYTHAHEGAHDLDVHGDGARAAQHQGQHRHPCSVKAQGAVRRPPQPSVFEITA